MLSNSRLRNSFEVKKKTFLMNSQYVNQHKVL